MFIYGRVKNGEIEIQRFFKDDIKKLEGKDVEIKELGSERTQQQNRYMWGVVYRLVAEHTGYTVEETHQVFRDRFLTYRKGKFEFTKSTTDLNTKEFGEYLDKVIDYAQQELEIIIPEPDIEYER
jgi:hypothetical protein